MWPVRLYRRSGHKYRQCGQFAFTKQRLPEEGARLAGRGFHHLQPRLWIAYAYGIVGRNVTRPGFDPRESLFCKGELELATLTVLIMTAVPVRQ